MKKIIALVALAFALAIGTAAVMTVHSDQAVACNNGNC
jgi:hypothetical protein